MSKSDVICFRLLWQNWSTIMFKFYEQRSKMLRYYILFFFECSANVFSRYSFSLQFIRQCFKSWDLKPRKCLAKTIPLLLIMLHAFPGHEFQSLHIIAMWIRRVERSLQTILEKELFKLKKKVKKRYAKLWGNRLSETYCSNHVSCLPHS